MTEAKINKEKKMKIYQSNDLVEAIYEDDLTATEHKIIRYAAGKIVNSPNDFPEVSFTVPEFVKAAGLSGKSYYSLIKNVASELTKKRIMIKTETEIGWFPWFKGIVYKNSLITIQFNDIIQPYLMDLTERGRYTKYDFPTIGEMRSPYTIRLFELLQQYAKIGKRKIKVEKLKEYLGVKDKYNQYGHFKSRILLKVQKELNNINVLTYDFDEIKVGRKVDEIEFTIKITEDFTLGENIPEEQINKFLEQAKPLASEYGYNISKQQLRAWTPYGIDSLREVLEDIHINNRKVSHVESYITTILKSRKKIFDKEKKNIKSDDYQAQKIILSYINDHRGRTQNSNRVEVVPKWMLKNKMFNLFSSSGYDFDEFNKIWEENEEYIYKEING